MPTVTREFTVDGKIYKINIEYNLSLTDNTVVVDLEIADLVLPEEPVPPVFNKLPVAEVNASSFEPNSTNIPENAIDGNPATRWSAQGSGQWIEVDLGKKQSIDAVGLLWYRGETRKSEFEVLVSQDRTTYTPAITRRQSNQPATPGIERYMFSTNIIARYVRVFCYGNTVNDWNSISELEVYGTEIPEPVLKEILYDVEGGTMDDSGNVKGTTADEFTLEVTTTNDDNTPRPSQEVIVLSNGEEIKRGVTDGLGIALIKHKFETPGSYAVEITDGVQ